MNNQIPDAFKDDAYIFKRAVEKSTKARNDLRNIRSSGDKIEEVTRDFLSSRIPQTTSIYSGHITDKEQNISKQFDIIGCEESFNPVISTYSKDNYLLYYEPVYFIGEIKKSFYNSEIISNFCDDIVRFRSKFNRESTFPFTHTINRIGATTVSNESGIDIGNPTLFFLIIADSNGISIDKEITKLNSREIGDLPSFILVINEGLFVNATFNEEGNYSINLYPDKLKLGQSEWIFLTLDDEYALLYYTILLNEHLRLTNLKNYSLLDYIGEQLGKNIKSIIRK